MNTEKKLGIVLVTTESQAQAELIAKNLVESKLAACVNILSCRSIYSWEEQLCNQEEWQMIIKTDLSLFPQLEAKINQLHSYEVPEIIALPIMAGSELYLSWLSNSVLAIDS
ncbi:MAG TPA: divalent-cation tolerance protein CutA [Allocoleopsis sp.]